MDTRVFLTDLTWPEAKARLPKVRLAIRSASCSTWEPVPLNTSVLLCLWGNLRNRLA